MNTIFHTIPNIPVIVQTINLFYRIFSALSIFCPHGKNRGTLSPGSNTVSALCSVSGRIVRVQERVRFALAGLLKELVIQHLYDRALM